MDKKKYLLLPASGLGDCIMLLPLAKKIKQNEPNSQVDILINAFNKSKSICENSPWVDQIIEDTNFKKYNLKSYMKVYFFKLFNFLHRINLNKYNTIMSVNPNFYRKTIGKIITGKFISKTQKNYHQLKLGLELYDGTEKEITQDLIKLPSNLQISVNKKFNLPENYICINYYGISKSRSWNSGIDFISRLKARNPNLNIIILGVKENHKKIDNVLDLVNETNILEASCIISQADLFITVDGGLLHIGMALNRPTIGIFGSVNSEFRKPINPEYKYFKAFNGNKEIKGYETNIEMFTDKNCLENIKIDQIIEEVEKFKNEM